MNFDKLIKDQEKLIDKIIEDENLSVDEAQRRYDIIQEKIRFYKQQKEKFKNVCRH